MTLEFYIMTAVITSLGVVGGLIIGYYKAVSVLSQRFISKEDCEKCGVRRDVETAAEDLRRGRKTFEAIKVDLAVIKTKLGIKNDLEELQKAISALKAQQHGGASP
jgi:hypothetical protein